MKRTTNALEPSAFHPSHPRDLVVQTFLSAGGETFPRSRRAEAPLRRDGCQSPGLRNRNVSPPADKNVCPTIKNRHPRRIPFLSALVTILALGLWAATAVAALPPHVPERILVKPKAGVTEAKFKNILANHSVKEVDRVHQINVRIIHVKEARLEKVLASLRKNPNIEFAEPDCVIEPALTPTDPYFSSEWHLTKIQAPQAWDMTTGSNTVIIAVLDTGVDGTQPDLAGKLVPGWNFYDNNSDTSDPNGHGTAVAGTAAAASNNGIGVASLAWGCLIMPVRVSDTNGVATTSTIGTALTWAADQGARVANISFAVFASPTVTSAAQYFQSKGGVTASSAGNNGKYYTNADNIYMLTVSATDSNDALATWSNTGNFVDLAAPGVGILTTGLAGGYVSGSGTSFSAPVVAGVAALVISLNPSLSGIDVRALLEQTADDLGPAGWDPSYGYGRINAYKAVLAAGGAPPDTTPPTATLSSPTNAATVSGTISVVVTGADNVGVTKLEWYLDGALQGSSASSSATFLWNTTTASNGSHTLQAKAYDAAGNTGTSGLITVSVNNAVPSPTASISAPSSGSTVSNSVPVDVVATDTVTITNVQWYLDGTLQGSSASATPTFSWNTTNCANGSHTLLAKVYDAAGSVASSASVGVTVNNPDVTLPTATITAPANGSTVSNTVSVSVTASDNVGVTKVEWYLDNVLQASSTSATPSFSWDTTTATNGPHSLLAKAYDAASNVGSSASVSVTVQNPVPDTTPPTATITAPADGTTVSNTVSVAVSATDDVGVTRVEWYLDGALQASSPTASANFSWDTTTVTNGSHTLLAKAYDAAGNTGSSASVSVTVNNPDVSPPTASITAPASGSTVSNTVSVTLSATDNIGVTKVEWYLDNVLQSSSTSATPTFSWDTTTAANGSHTLLAKAYDAAGNVGSSSSVTVTVQNPVLPASVTVTSPTGGTTITAKITKVYVTTVDSATVTQVAFVVDGKQYSTSTSSSPVFSWNTSKLSRGSHTLQATASDSAGNLIRSAVVTVYK